MRFPSLPISGRWLLAVLIALAVVAGFALDGDETSEQDLADRLGRTSESATELPPAPDVDASEAPDVRLRDLGLGEAPARSPRQEPDLLDPRQPPQWTEPLALPAADPEPPDPLERPPMEIDPSQRSSADTARRMIR